MKENNAMVYTNVNDSLDDEPMIDELGFPTDMDPVEREAILEREYEEQLALHVAETQAFLALGGAL